MTMFSSNTWKSDKFACTKGGKLVESTILDGSFWEDITICLRATGPIIRVLRLVDLEKKPAMGFLYYEMEKVREKIKINFNHVKKK
ncbi:hypothetical protein SLEP1_g6474 [Rubroshorea leprosula]|uniref:Photosystem I assembly protein Ycf4 n=1 Tax=Rubroshorea leprosula TaxID=152421 RepID=A0AAV5HVC5_9ROSI|nr:hypothetical protein SLEP1_g6474 [Rubroshorea leprosula]